MCNLTSSVTMWPIRRPAREEPLPLATFMPPAFQQICQLLTSHLHLADLATAKQVAVFNAIIVILPLSSFAGEYNLPRSGNTDKWTGASQRHGCHVVPTMWGVSNYFSILQCNRPVSDSKIVQLHLEPFISAHLITLYRSLLTSHDLEMRSWEELRSFLCMKVGVVGDNCGTRGCEGSCPP